MNQTDSSPPSRSPKWKKNLLSVPSWSIVLSSGFNMSTFANGIQDLNRMAKLALQDFIFVARNARYKFAFQGYQTNRRRLLNLGPSFESQSQMSTH